MDHQVQIDWAPVCPPQQQHPVDVRTPYQAGNDWTFSTWTRDAETQTSSVQSLMREVSS